MALELLTPPHRDYLLFLAAGKKTDTEEQVAVAAREILVRAHDTVSKRSSGLSLDHSLKAIRINTNQKKEDQSTK